MVVKFNGIWRMCFDFINLNKVCFKDRFFLFKIDQLVDLIMWYFLLSFFDVFSGYRQILLFSEYQEKIFFITDKGFYYYYAMFSGLKNVGVSY